MEERRKQSSQAYSQTRNNIPGHCKSYSDFQSFMCIICIPFITLRISFIEALILLSIVLVDLEWILQKIAISKSYAPIVVESSEIVVSCDAF